VRLDHLLSRENAKESLRAELQSDPQVIVSSAVARQPGIKGLLITLQLSRLAEFLVKRAR
jgi:hypothetical protein